MLPRRIPTHPHPKRRVLERRGSILVEMYGEPVQIVYRPATPRQEVEIISWGARLTAAGRAQEDVGMGRDGVDLLEQMGTTAEVVSGYAAVVAPLIIDILAPALDADVWEPLALEWGEHDEHEPMLWVEMGESARAAWVAENIGAIALTVLPLAMRNAGARVLGESVARPEEARRLHRQSQHPPTDLDGSSPPSSTAPPSSSWRPSSASSIPSGSTAGGER